MLIIDAIRPSLQSLVACNSFREYGQAGIRPITSSFSLASEVAPDFDIRSWGPNPLNSLLRMWPLPVYGNWVHFWGKFWQFIRTCFSCLLCLFISFLVNFIWPQRWLQAFALGRRGAKSPEQPFKNVAPPLYRNWVHFWGQIWQFIGTCFSCLLCLFIWVFVNFTSPTLAPLTEWGQTLKNRIFGKWPHISI